MYAVGRREITQHGRWTAALIACCEGAVLSHGSAAALYGLGPNPQGKIHVTVPEGMARRPPGISIHRARNLTRAHTRRHKGIPVTGPLWTFVDLATELDRPRLERAIAKADADRLILEPALRAGIDTVGPRPGVRWLRTVLDRRTFRLTRSELERRFIPLAVEAGLPVPDTGVMVNGYEVDFHWPAFGLVVETDGLAYHRTTGQQAKDRLRDQAHTAAGFTHLRFTHEQVAFEPDYVTEILGAVAGRLGAI